MPGTWGGQQSGDTLLSNKGYGTYRLTVFLRPEDQGTSLAIAVPSIATAYSLWINGELKDVQGIVGTTRDEMEAQNYTKAVYFTANQPLVELVLQVSNFVQRKGGMWDSMTLGSDEEITYNREKRIIMQIIIAGGLFIMGLYHIGVFVFRRSYKPPLWFATASLLICLRTLFTGDFLWSRLWPGFPWELAVKVEYLSAYLAIGFLVLYTHSIYPDDLPRKPTGWFFTVIVAISLPVLIFPAHIYTEFMQFSSFLLIVTMMAPVFGVILATYRKRPAARINLLFILLFFASVVNDVLFYNYILKTGDLLPWGLYSLLFAQTLMLAGRFSGAFVQVETLRDQLLESNQSLERRVKERTEELTLANEQLRQMEASRKDMLTNISHEFGTPLTSLIGYAAVMKEEELPQQSRRYIDIIHDKASLLQRLTVDLKNAIQLESNKLHLTHKYVDIPSWYSSIGDKFGMDVRAAGIQFVQTPLIEQDTLSNYRVNIDLTRIDQVLTNLIFNALAHTPKNGSITVSARSFIPWKKLLISVSDTGYGIKRSELSSIFDRFYKGSHSIAMQLPGSGLGLWISSEIMKQHGGRLGVRSKENHGSSFYLLFALHPRQEAEG